jgi:hypothetical protein
MFSMLTRYGVRPRSQQTSAAKRRVQVRRGFSCNNARNCLRQVVASFRVVAPLSMGVSVVPRRASSAVPPHPSRRRP